MAKPSSSDTFQLISFVIVISGATCQCTRADTQAPIHGMACQPFKYRNITAPKPKFCSLACVQADHCEATIYDKASGVCMLMNEPCFSLRPHFDHVYRSYKQSCTNWVPHDDINPAYWYMEHSTQQCYVARKAHESNYIIGKKTSNFFAVNPTGTALVIDGDYELVVVEPSCIVTWVQYNPTGAQAIPEGALIGGILTATNTPLYVARTTIDGITGCGYYNPLNGKIWVAHFGPRSSTVFEIMVVIK